MGYGMLKRLFKKPSANNIEHQERAGTEVAVIAPANTAPAASVQVDWEAQEAENPTAHYSTGEGLLSFGIHAFWSVIAVVKLAYALPVLLCQFVASGFVGIQQAPSTVNLAIDSAEELFDEASSAVGSAVYTVVKAYETVAPLVETVVGFGVFAAVEGGKALVNLFNASDDTQEDAAVNPDAVAIAAEGVQEQAETLDDMIVVADNNAEIISTLGEQLDLD